MLDPLPIPIIGLTFAGLSFLVYEVGFRVGRWWQRRASESEGHGPVGVIVGAVLGLMAFLLAVTMGMASDRFDTRRGIVLQEAKAIGTAYLRADYLPQPYRAQAQELLREYVPLRVLVSPQPGLIQERIERSRELLGRLWVVSTEGVQAAGSQDVLVLYVESINELIDIDQSRVAAGVYARVPDTILLVLLLGTVLALGVVGYSAGLAGRRSVISAAVLIVALGTVLMLIVDLDRSSDGYLNVSQQPIIDLQERLGPPSGG